MTIPQENNLKDYIEVFLRRKWLIIVPGIVCTAIALAVSISMPSLYRSNTMIILDQQKVPEEYVTPTDITPFEQRLNTISQQIMSRSRLEQIINDYKLYTRGDGEGLIGTITKRIPFIGDTEPSSEEIIAMMRDDIDVRVIGGGGRRGGDAFSISYVNKDPYTAMRVTDKLASLFIEGNLRIREQYAEGTTEFLQDELEKAKAELEEQERALREFKEPHMGALPEQLEANLRTLDRLQLERQSINEALINAENNLALKEEQLGIGTTTDSPSGINPYERELLELKKRLSTLLTVYKDNYPDVIITKNRIRELEKKVKAQEESDDGQQDEEFVDFINQEAYDELLFLKSKISSLKKRDADILRQIEIYEKRVEETPANEQMMAAIRRNYDISLKNYQALLEKKLNARLAQNLEKRQKGERFRIIDSANLPEKPYKPNRLKITLLGFIFGTGAGTGLALALEFITPTFRKPQELADYFGYPVLATIPQFPSSFSRKGRKSQ